MAAAIEVRDARRGDAGALVALWRELTTIGSGHSSRLPPAPSVAAAEVAVGKHLADPSGRLLVGELDGAVHAMAYLRRTAISPLHDDTTVTIEYLHVSDAARRHGLGKALIAEAVAWAEHEKCPHLAAVAPAVAREANRFLARLGLGQAGILRFANTHTVARRMAAEHAPNLLALLSSRRSVIARRAQLSRATAEPAVSYPPEPESAGR
ncbi:GNAT family N-acetyltransferase [Kribbella sandramycini]|uniref:GNAT family N-acetyltransferase n=1 Tax=Kribbella sandramycini TaxID=60450 RepID=A0A7Y4KTX0_9ACTN|nr:GNAT family N-acetyltransferase [Kribbella sandramycini]